MMKEKNMRTLFKNIFFIALFFVGAVQAATLQLYKDSAQYRLKTPSAFIGFAPGDIEAECKDATIETFASPKCKKKSALCELKNHIEALELKSASLQAQAHLIDTMIKQSKPQKIDAKTWLEAIEKLGARYALLQKKAKDSDIEAKNLRRLFFSQAPTMQARYLSRPCNGILQLNIPGGLIDVEIFYEADILTDESLKITQIARLRNRSGIDIYAKRADIFSEPITRALRPIKFSPWIIRESRMAPLVKHRMEKRMVVDMALAKEVRYVNPRHYRLRSLHLPSNGEVVRTEIKSWKIPFEKENVLFPYVDLHVYEALRYKPPVPIESDRWSVKSGKRTIAKEVYGRYDGEKYLIFAAIDRDLIAKKEPYIPKSGEHGIIFGKRIKKVDGYTIEIINQSNEKRDIHIVERVPVSTKEEIRVELTDVKANVPIRYRVAKNGKLLIDLSIPAKKEARVDVRFTVSWPKDIPVIY